MKFKIEKKWNRKKYFELLIVFLSDVLCYIVIVVYGWCIYNCVWKVKVIEFGVG